MDKEEKRALQLGAEYIILPCIRNEENPSLLENRGYSQIGASIGSVTSIESSLETIFDNQTSRRYFSNNRRHKRIVEENYSLRSFVDDEITEQVLQITEMTHDSHCRKYEVPNIFSREILDKMLLNRGGAHVRISIRYCKETGDAVQSILALEFPSSKTLHYQSQAILRDLVPKNHNLYRTSYLELYEYAIDKGYESVSLGRGFQELKTKELAANKTYQQSHWIKKLAQ